MNGKSYLNNKNKLGSFKTPGSLCKTGHIPGRNGEQRQGGLKEPSIDLQTESDQGRPFLLVLVEGLGMET